MWNFKLIGQGVRGLRLPKIGGLPLTLNVALTTLLHTSVLHCDVRCLFHLLTQPCCITKLWRDLDEILVVKKLCIWYQWTKYLTRWHPQRYDPIKHDKNGWHSKIGLISHLVKILYLGVYTTTSHPYGVWSQKKSLLCYRGCVIRCVLTSFVSSKPLRVIFGRAPLGLSGRQGASGSGSKRGRASVALPVDLDLSVGPSGIPCEIPVFTWYLMSVRFLDKPHNIPYCRWIYIIGCAVARALC